MKRLLDRSKNNCQIRIWELEPLSLHTEFYEDMSSGRKYSVAEGEEVTIRAARRADVPGIAYLLQSIQITPENLDVKLSPNNKGSFKNKGGFFVVWNAEQLSGFMQDSKNLILLASVNDNGKENICGFLWCRLALDCISVSDWGLNTGILDKYLMNKFVTALDKNLIVTAVECAVHPNGRGVGISYAIIYEMYNWLMRKGFLYSVLQVYRILGEYREDGFVKSILPNEASIRHIKKYGAVWIKTASVPDQTVGDRKIRVSADVFMLDLEKAVLGLKELIAEVALGKQDRFGTGGHL